MRYVYLIDELSMFFILIYLNVIKLKEIDSRDEVILSYLSFYEGTSFAARSAQ